MPGVSLLRWQDPSSSTSVPGVTGCSPAQGVLPVIPPGSLPSCPQGFFQGILFFTLLFSKRIHPFLFCDNMRCYKNKKVSFLVLYRLSFKEPAQKGNITKNRHLGFLFCLVVGDESTHNYGFSVSNCNLGLYIPLAKLGRYNRT